MVKAKIIAGSVHRRLRRMRLLLPMAEAMAASMGTATKAGSQPIADGTVQTLTLKLTSSNGSSGLLADSSSSTATSGGSVLLAGELLLYVDNSSGLFNADELARVENAITAVDATVSPYGADIVEVTDPTLANVIVDTGTTTALGGLAQGVLGCTTDAGELTIVQGWNWYAGSDPAGMAAGQYDFQTVLTHELGHALGLGHSSTATSVMYGSLGTDVAKRALITADLNIPDTDTGACGLHAEPPVSHDFASLASVINENLLTLSPSQALPLKAIGKLDPVPGTHSLEGLLTLFQEGQHDQLALAPLSTANHANSKSVTDQLFTDYESTWELRYLANDWGF